MVRRNIRPCSICAGVSATSTVKWCGAVALTMVSSEVAKRWSSAASENADRLAAVAANSSNRVRRDVMRRLGVPRSETTNTKHTLKGLAMISKLLHPATLAAQALGWTDGSTGSTLRPRSCAIPTTRSTTSRSAADRTRGRCGLAGVLLGDGGGCGGVPESRARHPWGLRAWLKNFAEAWGIEVTFVDTTSLDALRRAVRPGRTRL